MARRAALLAVDGGNSKSELVLAAADGTLLAHRRGPTISHQAIAPDDALPLGRRAEMGMRRLATMAREAAAAAGLATRDGRVAGTGSLCLAGADFASDVRLLTAAIQREGLVDEVRIYNDAFAPLRAGTDRPWGVAVICGAGVNAAAIAPDGRTARFAALGDISGDWGGGTSVGQAALAAAVRARDGRGPRTELERLVPRHFGMARPDTLTRRLYDGRIREARLRELAPVVFDAAIRGDLVARGIVDRLADELAVMAIALARRLRMTRATFDVVLAGGIFRTRDQAFIGRIDERVRAEMRDATVRTLAAPPVLGAALLALDHLPHAAPGAADRLRRALEQRPAASDA